MFGDWYRVVTDRIEKRGLCVCIIQDRIARFLSTLVSQGGTVLEALLSILRGPTHYNYRTCTWRSEKRDI